ncbi:MAG: hypothetical protein Q9162_007324 [Coniocarpon cinnabarinum]
MWEPKFGYCPGGFHPVMIGDVFKGRYEIVYKLGYGSSATVWLARDSVVRRFVALKFVLASSGVSSEEREILQYVTQRKSDPTSSQQGQENVIDLLDFFTSTSVNGDHQVLVTNVVRSIREFRPTKEDELGLPGQQLLAGLDFLHRNGIIHNDLCLSNVGYAVELTESDFSLLPSPDITPISHRPDWSEHQPQAFVSRFSWEDWVPPIPMGGRRFQICDFGCAGFTSPGRTDLVHDFPSFIPEIRLGKATCFSPQTDIWSLGCLLYVWEHEEDFFDEDEPDEAYIQRLLVIHSDLPEEWMRLKSTALAAIANRPQELEEQRDDFEDTYCYCEPNVSYKKYLGEIMLRHNNDLRDFLRRAWTIRPEDRPSAAELLSHPYLHPLDHGHRSVQSDRVNRGLSAA